MNLDAVRRVADAVLYEGYILYPYRASAQKNRSRWQFGVLMPPGYAAADPSETTKLRAECVFEHSGAPAVTVITRFLQVQRRTRLNPDTDPDAPASWDEAVEHDVPVTVEAGRVLGDGQLSNFVIPGGVERADGVIRTRARLAGTVSVRAEPLPGPWRAARLIVEVTNKSGTEAAPVTRDQALPAALVAAHLIICVSGGNFLSMTDPPEWATPAVGACHNAGCWPVLAAPSRQVMLASPIILPDYPEVAPESAGELYDGTEIDEILTLRTLALSDEEKREARATDPRAAALLDRVEAMDGPTMDRLHGTFRTPQAPWWDPAADASVSPETDTVTVAGQRIGRGSQVTLRPGIRRADAQDMFLAGRAAIVEAVLLDVDDNPYLAVSLVEQPAAAHGRFLYFAPDEVEP
jgi:hypothetical protein